MFCYLYHKTQVNFTIETISKASGVPEATVKNVFSGKTEDPRFETISAIVKAMGDSLDAIYNGTKEENIEANTIITLKDTYDQKMVDLKHTL